MAKAKQVTSFTLVWIKMPLRCAWRIPAGVTSFTLVWIKMPIELAKAEARRGHELHARVD